MYTIAATFVVIASLAKITELIKIGNISISPVSSIRHIWAMCDCEVYMAVQVQQVPCSVSCQLYNISKIHHHITTDQTNLVIHTYVTSELNCNVAFLYNTP